MHSARFRIAFCLSTVLLTGSLKAQELPPAPSASWRQINDQVVQELKSTDLGTLARQVREAPKPKTPEQWLRKLTVLARADYRAELLQMLAHRPDFLTKKVNWNFDYFLSLTDDRELSLKFCEAFPEQRALAVSVQQPSFWTKWAKDSSPQVVDTWLKKRTQEAPQVWFDIYLRYRATQGTEAELLAPLEARVRANPESYEAAEAYYLAVRYLPKKPDTSWLATVCKPRLTMERYQLVGMLGSPAAAIPLLESLQDASLTPEDGAWYKNFIRRNPYNHHIMEFNGPNSETFQGWVKNALLENYRATGQVEKAQALTERLAKAFPGGVPQGNFAVTAGQVQASSGLRVIETAIKQAEPENQSSPAYWRARGNYYYGRKEFAEGRKAFDKALELAPFTDNDRHERGAILQEYYYLILHETNQHHQALSLLYDELKKIPLSSRLATRLMGILASQDTGRLTTQDREGFVKSDDPLYWQYLESTRDWGQFDLLKALLRNDSGASLKRLEALARKSPETRMHELGFVLYLQKNDPAAIACLEEALPVAPQFSTHLNSREYLWHLYIRTNAWKKAEALPYPYGSRLDLCYAAARAGDTAAAMRFYRQYINLDRRYLGAIGPLEELGLGSELKAFYSQLIREEPRGYTRERLLKSPYAYLAKETRG